MMEKLLNCHYIIWIVMLCWASQVMGLKITALRVPTHVVRGGSVRLECLYDLEDDSLYSVRWYKDGLEFYRYVPRDNPVQYSFPSSNFNVIIENSTDTSILLNRLQLSGSGRYQCEVSAEAPTFQSVGEHADMEVVALPDDGPSISGGKLKYQVGDKVHVNCTSGRSKPAANLTWFINGDPADQSFVSGPYVNVEENGGLETSVLALNFVVKHKHFHRGDMKLKCLATIATVYWRSNEERIEGEKLHRSSAKKIVQLQTPSLLSPNTTKAKADLVKSSGQSTYSVHMMSVVLFMSIIFL